MSLKKVFANIAYRLFKDELPKPEPVQIEVPVIREILVPEVVIQQAITTQLLHTHEAHEDFLAGAIQAAERNLLIISPTISINRLTARLRTGRFEGTLSDLFEMHARTKNIRIICSDDMNQEQDGAFKMGYESGLDLLMEAGCKVNRKWRIHHKTLALDQRLITEGSYNWLGVREDHRREKTIVCEGPEVGQRIAEEWKWQRSNKKGHSTISARVLG